VFVVTLFLHSVRIESQRFAHSFMAGVAETQAEFVKVSCAITNVQRYVHRSHNDVKRRFAMVIWGVGAGAEHNHWGVARTI
jgi:hypothetical protein